MKKQLRLALIVSLAVFILASLLVFAQDPGMFEFWDADEQPPAPPKGPYPDGNMEYWDADERPPVLELDEGTPTITPTATDTPTPTPTPTFTPTPTSTPTPTDTPVPTPTLTPTVPTPTVTPTPTISPTPGECGKTYGHAAVLVVNPVCHGLMSFRLRQLLPEQAHVTDASLQFYVVAHDGTSDVIYLSVMNKVWSETGADWCGYKWYQEDLANVWQEMGAIGVPFDREPAHFAEVTIVGTGWYQVDIPTAMVEAWNTTGAANPGILFHNNDMVGRVQIASREWVIADEDILPRLVVDYYTD